MTAGRVAAGPRADASLSLRLTLSLAALAIAGLGAVCTVVFVATAASLEARQQAELDEKAELVSHLVGEAESDEDTSGLRHLLEDIGIGYAGLTLRLAPPDGPPLFESPRWTPEGPPRQQVLRTAIPWSRAPGGLLAAELRLDTRGDDRLLGGLAATLLGAALGGAALIALASFVLVRRGLAPVGALAAQLRRIRPGDGTARLDGPPWPRELERFVERFEALLREVDVAYAQLASFDADVAHELRTPLAVLIADGEVMMSRPRSEAQWREACERQLEDLRRLAAIVADMLVLARADGTSPDRRADVPSLAALVAEVAADHGPAFDERRLALAIVGDASGRVDAELLRRAISNLLSNAARHARPGTGVEVRLDRDPEGPLRLVVRNLGTTIPPDSLPRIFDRFYRAGTGADADDGHHGLGLAIVAAIARMHGGRPIARSASGLTEIGLELGVAPGARGRRVADAVSP